MKTTAKAPPEEKGQSVALWFGVLGGPAAWVVQVASGYILEDTACSPASTSQSILTIDIEPLYTGLTAALAMLTLAAGLTAFRCMRRIGRVEGGVAVQRAFWMARAGVIVSVLFLVIIGLAFASIGILSVCEIPL